MKPVYSVVDLFCGCGGLSYGFEATKRFHTLLGIDSAAAALATFKRNIGYRGRPVQTINADLSTIKPLEVRKLLRTAGISVGDLDCLVGGPPCEGFSQNRGKRSASHEKYDFIASKSSATRFWDVSTDAPLSQPAARKFRSEREDVRNALFRIMLNVAEATRPKIVIIENVREMLTYCNGAIKDEITAYLQRLGYSVEVEVLNAADYGVPQVRRRAFIIAVRKDVLGRMPTSAIPKPTHQESKQYGRGKTLPGDKGRYVSVWEAIGDLPRPCTAHDKESRPGRPRALKLTRFREYTRRDIAVMNHDKRVLSGDVLLRVRAMRPGMRSHHLPSYLRTKKFFYNAYGRLEWNRPANTITKSFIYLGSGKFSHPEQDRGLTIREAARLQSFPDDFIFTGPSSKVVACMVGGSVPPLLAMHVAVRLAEILDAYIARKDTDTSD